MHFFVNKFSILISNNICLYSKHGKKDLLAIYYQEKLYLAIPKSGGFFPQTAELRIYLSRQLKHDLHKFSIVETSPLNTIIK
jgi:hypothetical protein